MGEEHGRAAVPEPHGLRPAAFGAPGLRVDALGDPAAVEAVLDQLPVALAAAGAEHAEVLVLAREEHPVLQPRTHAPAVEHGARRARADARHAARERLHRSERIGLPLGVDDDRGVAVEHRRGRLRRGSEEEGGGGEGEDPHGAG